MHQWRKGKFLNHKIRLTKLLLLVPTVTFLSIIVPAEYNLPIFIGLVFGLPALFYEPIPMIFPFAATYFAIGTLLFIQISEKVISPNRITLVKISMVLLWCSLIYYHFQWQFKIKNYDALYLILPELAFWLSSALVFILSFRKRNTITGNDIPT